MSWSHVTGLFLQDHKTPLLLALETALEDEEFDNSDVIKMLLERGAVYDVKDGVSYAVYNVTKHVNLISYNEDTCIIHTQLQLYPQWSLWSYK